MSIALRAWAPAPADRQREIASALEPIAAPVPARLGTFAATIHDHAGEVHLAGLR